jgi:hypothetical protein
MRLPYDDSDALLLRGESNSAWCKAEIGSCGCG